jgi:hypothetical protein
MIFTIGHLLDGAAPARARNAARPDAIGFKHSHPPPATTRGPEVAGASRAASSRNGRAAGSLAPSAAKMPDRHAAVMRPDLSLQNLHVKSRPYRIFIAALAKKRNRT